MNILSSRTPGNLDPDFGNGGQAPIPEDLQTIRSALLSDQKILSVTTETGSDVVTLIRHLSTGELDESYGEQGFVRIRMPGGQHAGGMKLRILADDSCMVSGPIGDFARSYGLVFRVLASGALDSEFGNDGFCLLDKGGFSTSVLELDVLSDGKVMVAVSDSAGSYFEFFLGRLDNGHLDSSYGEEGSGWVNVARNPIKDVVALPNGGALLVYGPSDGSKAVLRQYLPSGRPDPAFGQDGVFDMVLEHGGFLEVQDLLLQPDGKIVAVGMANVGFGSHFLVFRLNPDASMDSTFNNGEPKIMVFQGHEAGADYAAIHADGRVVLAGTSVSHNIVLMRFMPNAAIDTTFGNNGQVMTDLGARESVNQVEIQADGNILVVGDRQDTSPGGPDGGLLLRYLG